MSHRMLIVFGTRPEAIKMAPVVHAMSADDAFDVTIAATAQHREMLDQVLDLFSVVPDYDLDIMEHGQSLTQVTTRVLEGIGAILEESAYDAVVVHGDTTTTLATALAAFYHGVPIAHVEAGMRSGDLSRPFPEEANRMLVARLTHWNFAPSDTCVRNLIAEGVDPKRVYRTVGNTVVDALSFAAAKPYEFPLGPVRSAIESGRRIVLVTAHRRESWGGPIENIFRAVRKLAFLHPDVQFLVAAHSNPVVTLVAERVLRGVEGVTLIGAQEYLPFVKLMSHADLILSDSGGIQEEGPAVGSPVLVLRDVTEYKELLEAGAVALAGTDERRIVEAASSLLGDKKSLMRMAEAGAARVRSGASQEVVGVLKKELGAETPR